jgi:hypothetical protein
MKRLLLFLLFPAIAFADNAGLASAFVIGTAISDNTASRNDALNATSATMRNAYGWLAPVSCTIDEFCLNIATRTGSPDSDDGVLDICPDVGGEPNEAGVLSSGTFDVSSTGFKCSTISQAVVAGTQYWFQVTNQATTQASNYFSIYQGPENVIYAAGSHASQNIGSAFQRSTDNGATWTALSRVGSAPYRVHCSSGAYYGFPLTADDVPNNPIAAADRVYGTAEVGNYFTTPANAKLNVKCIRMRAQKATGTPTGFLEYSLYTGTTRTATTAPMTVVSSTNNAGAITLCFSSAQTLLASTVYRVSMRETTQSDTSSNAYGPHRLDFDTNAASLALKPFNGTIKKTVCASSCDGGTWTETSGSYYEMQLVLDPGNEFSTTGGLLRHPGTNGGIQ